MGPSQITLSEKKVQKFRQLLIDDYINPFDMDLDKAKLSILTSGAPVDNAAAVILLHVYDNGNTQAELFWIAHLVNMTSLFHNPVKQCWFVNFKDTSKFVFIRKDNKTLSVKANPNIIEALLIYSTKSGKFIGIKKVLMSPLSPILLNISNGDGTLVTSKSKLF